MLDSELNQTSNPGAIRPMALAGRSLKRKSSDLRSSIFTKNLENARDLHALCREHEEEIAKLKARSSSREKVLRG